LEEAIFVPVAVVARGGMPQPLQLKVESAEYRVLIQTGFMAEMAMAVAKGIVALLAMFAV
jgi:hypothetical protein